MQIYTNFTHSKSQRKDTVELATFQTLHTRKFKKKNISRRPSRSKIWMHLGTELGAELPQTMSICKPLEIC